MTWHIDTLGLSVEVISIYVTYNVVVHVHILLSAMLTHTELILLNLVMVFLQAD